MDKDEMINCAQFDQIKEMLLCLEESTYCDNELVLFVNSHGGLYKYFDEVKSRYVEFRKKVSK